MSFVGTTESFGEGNGDVLLLKLDNLGKELSHMFYRVSGAEGALELYSESGQLRYVS
ncbi:MAG: hypothetical protein ACJASM_001382 [Salibacteraceae bacterium]